MTTEEQATKYTTLGWIVHPIKPAVPGDKRTGKAPIESGWQKRLAPRTEEEIRRYFKDADHNIGLLCGQASGITVIDVDDPLFIPDLTRGIEMKDWLMSSREGSDRGHIYFKYTPDLRAQKHHQLGLEVLSDGNNCVLPPSTHYSGTQYSWNRDPAEGVPEMPTQLKNRLIELFKTEQKLKALTAHGRPCFRAFMQDPEVLHGAEGRQYMLALATELTAAAEELDYGRNETLACIHMAARLIYKGDYNRARTNDELGHVSASKTWRCDTLKEAFYDRCNCEDCKYKGKGQAPETKQALQKAAGAFQGYLGMAADMQTKVPIIYDRTGTFWVWTKGTGYQRTDETDILIALKDTLDIQGITKARTRAEILEAIRITARERYDRTKPAKQTWIHFKDCVVDYETGQRFEASPAYFFSAPVPWNLGTSEETPQIDKLLEDWVGEDRKQQLYEILAYCLLDAYPIHRIFCLIGRGRNGKGQYMKLMRTFLGNHSVTSTEMERLIESRFETAKLYQRKCVFIGETNFSAISKTSRLKQLSGEDVVTGEFKRKTPFDFVNTAKIIIATNSLPQTHDRTDGFYSRWMVVDFENQFPEGHDTIDPLPEQEFENLAYKSLEVLKNLLIRGRIHKEGTIEERMRKYEERSNPLAAFIKEHCNIENKDAWCPLFEIFDRYDVFQNQNGHRKITKRQLSSQLEDMGYDKEKGRIEDFNGVYFWGIELRKAPAPGPQLQMNTDPENPALYTPVPGASIFEEAERDNPELDRAIIEAVKEYSNGSMYVPEIATFTREYLRRRPYAQREADKIAGRIRILKQRGWRLNIPTNTETEE